MLTRRVGWLLALILAVPPASAHAGPEPLAPRARTIASHFSFLGVADALYDRVPRLKDELDPLQKSLHKLEKDHQANEVRSILHDHDARVRTLGIVLAFRECRLELLPEVALLVTDAQETFPQPAMVQMAFGSAPLPLEPVAVKQYALEVINDYIRHSDELAGLQRSGKLPFSDPGALSETLRRFDSTRDSRLSTCGLLVALDQATGQMWPLQPDRTQRVANVLDKLMQVPMPRRFFVARLMDFDRYRQENYAPGLLLDLARQVPRNARLDAIRGNRPIEDLDVPAGACAEYFLDHATDLLRASDSQMLLQQATPAAAPARSRCFTAAAELSPARADDILIPALGKFTEQYQHGDRTRISVALARLGGEGGLTEAINWFFREKADPGAYGFGREAFLDQLHTVNPVRFRDSVARIVRDERLFTLGPASTRTLILAVQGYLGRTLVDEEDLRISYGIDEAQRNTKLKSLPAWQKSLRDTVDEWDITRQGDPGR